MTLLYQWGLYILDSLIALGDFLLFKPFSSFPLMGDVVDLIASSPFSNEISDFVDSIANMSIASIIFGGSLIAIIIFKVVKFVVGIVTGS